MNNHIFSDPRENSTMQVESNSQANNIHNNNDSELDEQAQNEILQELQIKRDTRNTSEKFRDQELPDLYNSGVDSKSIENATHSDQISQASTNHSSLESLDEAPLQLPPVVTNTERNAIQTMSGSIMNILNNVINPIRQPSLPSTDHIQPPRPRLPSLFNLFTSLPVFTHNRNNLRSISNSTSTNNSEEPNTESEVNSVAQFQQANQNQSEDLAPHMMEHGAIIVRTVQPGPNGLMIVRMRVIPFNEIFGGQAVNHIIVDHDGTHEHDHAGMFGTLFRLLMQVSDFHVDRGLPKETLDSLPVVPFDTEGFKNVDEGNKKCPICFDQYEDGQDLRYLWCLHRFHKGCVDQWLGSHSNCPICKKDFSEIDKTDYE